MRKSEKTVEVSFFDTARKTNNPMYLPNFFVEALTKGGDTIIVPFVVKLVDVKDGEEFKYANIKQALYNKTVTLLMSMGTEFIIDSNVSKQIGEFNANLRGRNQVPACSVRSGTTAFRMIYPNGLFIEAFREQTPDVESYHAQRKNTIACTVNINGTVYPAVMFHINSSCDLKNYIRDLKNFDVLLNDQLRSRMKWLGIGIDIEFNSPSK